MKPFFYFSRTAFALVNIKETSKKHDQIVGDSYARLKVLQTEAVPKLVELLKSDEIELARHSAWALGKIVNDSPVNRDIAFQCGAAEILSRLLEVQQPASKLC